MQNTTDRDSRGHGLISPRQPQTILRGDHQSPEYTSKKREILNSATVPKTNIVRTSLNANQKTCNFIQKAFIKNKTKASKFIAPGTTVITKAAH